MDSQTVKKRKVSKTSLADAVDAIGKAEEFSDEHRQGMHGLFKAVDIFNNAITNQDEVNNLCRLIDEAARDVAAGDKMAQTQLRAYKTQLKTQLFDIALNLGFSVVISATGAAFTCNGYQLVLTYSSLGVCSGAVFCVLGSAAMVLAGLTACIALCQAVNVMVKLWRS